MSGLARGIVAAALLAVPGCFGNTRPVTRYYQVSVNMPQPTAAPAKPQVLQVRRFNARDPYAQVRIAYRPTPYELGYYNYHMWASLPGEQVAEWTVRYLRGTGQFDRVVTSTEGSADLLLGGTIREFEEVDHPSTWEAALTIDFWLARPDQTAPPWFRSYHEACPTARRNPDALSEAMSHCLEKILGRLAAELPAAVAEVQTSPPPAGKL